MSYMVVKKDRYTTGEKSLTKKEYDKLISVVDNLEDETLLKLAISTGIRREDIVKIKIADIIEENDQTKLNFYESKKRRIWTVPLSPEIVLLIKKLVNSRGKLQSDLLITYSGRTAHRRLQKYCEKAGIPQRPFHALRATCIKFCQTAGWSAEQVSRLTGDTIAVIQIHYSTPSTTEMQEVVNNKPII